MSITESYIVGEAEYIRDKNYGLCETLEQALRLRQTRQLEYPKKKIVIEEILTYDWEKT